MTINEFINAMNDRGNAEGRVEVWGVVAEMQEDDVKPNRVTCSNLWSASTLTLRSRTSHGP